MPAPAPITSRTNARVKLLRAAFSGKASRPGELVGVEGIKAVQQAFEAGLRIDALAVAASCVADPAVEQLLSLIPQDPLVLADPIMASVTDTGSAPPLVATVAIPEDRLDAPPSVNPSVTPNGTPSGLFLLLEAIQDPGNLGTLIRSAEAFSVERVFLSPGCANPWSPKVLRASAGSVFRQPVRKQSLSSAITALQRDGVRIVGAVARQRGAQLSFTAALAAPLGVVIGNEGSGLSADILSLVDERVYIPCATESLNAAVAGSLLLYDAVSRGVPA